MKITIDTKEDSHEDIRKIISMLSALVSGQSKESYSPMDIFSDSGISNSNASGQDNTMNTLNNPNTSQETSVGTGGIFDLFKDDKIQGQQNPDKQEDEKINPEEPVTLTTY